ncbi:MAG: hypothetical protein MZV65_33950 [Chromatiales bacterium]|nr:hypothetical protein [Chromatiales bacterium]
MRRDPRARRRCSPRLTGARLGYLPEAPTAVGASLAGAMPHRGAGRRQCARPGVTPARCWTTPPARLPAVGGIEPATSTPATAIAQRRSQGADCVVALTRVSRSADAGARAT